MEEILKKYYEYFIKGNFQDKIRIDDNSEFYKFYKIIINEYNVKENEQIWHSIIDFFDFFDRMRFTRSFGIFSPSKGEDVSKEKYKRSGFGCFDWFKASKNMVRNESFVYTTKRSDNIFCKAYLSIKPEKYVEVLIKLQEFIDELYEKYPDEELGQCKFRNVPSNDAIVMRFSSEEHYNEFVQFLNKNTSIKESFDIPNLFMPQDENGISVIPDNCGSYNYFVTRMIWDYMFYVRENNLEVSIDGIIEFINNYDCSKDKMISENGEKIINDYKAILIGKLSSKSNEELLSYVFKEKSKALKK